MCKGRPLCLPWAATGPPLPWERGRPALGEEEIEGETPSLPMPSLPPLVGVHRSGCGPHAHLPGRTACAFVGRNDDKASVRKRAHAMRPYKGVGWQISSEHPDQGHPRAKGRGDRRVVQTHPCGKERACRLMDTRRAVRLGDRSARMGDDAGQRPPAPCLNLPSMITKIHTMVPRLADASDGQFSFEQQPVFGDRSAIRF
jgi:hypothetical protein